MKEFSDEIIVVDTGSEDRTVEIAEAEGAVVYHFEWCNDFSAAKNYALDQATGDWIVFLDADEYFDEEARKQLRPALNRIHGNRNILGIDSLLYNIDADRNNEIKSIANQKRVFRNSKKLRYRERIHEYLVYYGTKKAAAFAYSEDFAIYHTGYSQTLTYEKNKRNLDMLLADIEAEGGEKPAHYSYLSVSYFNLRQYDKAIHYAELAVQAGSNGIKSAIVKQYSIWIKAEQLRQASTETLQHIIDKALTDIPGQPDFLWEDAKLALQRRDFVLAEQRLQEILTNMKNKELMRQYESSITGQLPIIYAAVGKILDMKGQNEKAVQFYKLSLKDAPYKENVLRDLLRLLPGQDVQESIHWLDTVYKETNDRRFLARLLRNSSRDEIYAHFACPEKGSYDELMSQKKYSEAADVVAKKLAYTLGSSEYLGSDAVVDEAASLGSDLMLALLAVPDETFAEHTNELSILPQGIRNCLIRFHSGDCPMSPDDAVAYHAMLGDVLQYSTPEVIDRFALLSKDLEEEDILQTALCLFDKGRWQTVLGLYQQVSEDHKMNLPGYWYYAGICYFHLGELELAYHYLENAQTTGMKSPDLNSYMAWCKK